MACTSHPLASEAAINILRRGGNAMDAAIAACAVQCVVEPESTGIGGDCFCIYAPEGSTDLIAFNGSGRAPRAATAEWYLDRGISEIARHTPHAVTIPGAVDAWQTLAEDHGRMSLGELLEPAIALACDGYPISSRVAYDHAAQLSVLRSNENAARIFLNNGEVPEVGSLRRQPELGATLSRIARDGRDGFYCGEVADDIVGYLNSLGGLHSLEDFASCKGEYVEPISTEFRGHEVYECPPNGQGVIALLALNIIEQCDLANASASNLERICCEIEAGRRAYADRALYVADPDFCDIPVEMLLSREHAAQLLASISSDGSCGTPAPAWSGPAHNSTVYITVVDSDRNACSFINSLFDGFGSGLVTPRTGVTLQNRGQGFVIEPGHPNCIRPAQAAIAHHHPRNGRKERARRDAIRRDGRPVPGLRPHAPSDTVFRFRPRPSRSHRRAKAVPHSGTDEVEFESTVPDEIRDGLLKRGYNMVPAARPIGGAQAIWVDWDENVLTGASDPRKDGCCIGY